MPFPVFLSAMPIRPCAAWSPGFPPDGNAALPPKTRIYNNLKSFFEKQSRFRLDVHDFLSGFISSQRAKLLFRRGFPLQTQSLYDWASGLPAAACPSHPRTSP
jgi:hypothetical protein